MSKATNIRFRTGYQGYFVHAEGREWGQVDQRGGLYGMAVWIVTEARDKRVRIDGPSFRDVAFRTRREAADALINATKEVASSDRGAQ